ncbi:hypothetical protein ACFXO7_38715 [Nocardia tengchongensis]|uniref:hypothetical protein n=1 Tax=Nocardia tengchongensis TaxID=2055889 RepID=UPI0036BE2045
MLAPPIAAVVPAVLDAVAAALAPWSLNAATPNFGLYAHDGSADTLAAWTEPQRERLVAARRRYDPTGVFAPAARWNMPEN